MSKQDEEIERLRRLREKQLGARDPHVKQRQTARHVATQHKKRQKFRLDQLLGDLSHKWQGLLLGLFTGLLLAVLLTIFVTASWVNLVAVLLIVGSTVIGLIFGASFDWRDDMRNF